MTDFDPDAFAEAVGRRVKEIAAKIESRMASLERALAERPDLEAIAQQAAALIPAPEQGKDTDSDVIKQMLADAVAALPAAKDGRDGKDGENGKDGTSVPLEEVERMVAEAVTRAMQSVREPKDGVDGKDGKDGVDGRDALEIDVLPAINEERSYCKGTFASHNGGIWIARRKTHGMDGWECIVNGWASTEIITFSERGFEVSVTDATGNKTTKQLELPAMIYRGVFTPGMHHPGDMVTFGGSLWHCNEPTDKKPGEPGCKAWTLTAKRGRDGKDGRDGIDKTAPVKLR
ncbi:phage portal protein [Halopseudomonas sp.]|uniref:phage portal protein n=1 Tax=Halopseudomonas sp. TaxID=2901191 RepID=UPI00311FA374